MDWFLRYTGLTDKGTARAAGHIVNDAFAATGVGVAGKAAVKSTVRGISKGLGKGAPKTTALPKELKSYVREVESKSGLRVHPKQQEMLAKDLRENRYQKLTPEERVEHSKPFQNRTFKDSLISEWEAQTGQSWPRYSQPVYKKDGSIFKKIGDPYDAHHINPQQIKGQHQWWNMHPTPVDQHQGGIHGSGSKLNDILKSLGKK